MVAVGELTFLEVQRICNTFPYFPLRTTRLSSRYAGSNLRINPMPTIDLDLFAVCATFLASESLEANGFSQRTSLPAAIAIDKCSA